MERGRPARKFASREGAKPRRKTPSLLREWQHIYVAHSISSRLRVTCLF